MKEYKFVVNNKDIYETSNFLSEKPYITKYLRSNGIILDQKPTTIELNILSLFKKYINALQKRNNDTEEDDDDSDPTNIFEFFEKFKKLFWKAQQYNLNLENILNKIKNDLLKIKNDLELERILIMLKTLKENRNLKIINKNELLNNKTNKIINNNTSKQKEYNINENNKIKDSSLGILTGIKTLVGRGISSPKDKTTYIKSYKTLKNNLSRLKEIFNKIVMKIKSILPNINLNVSSIDVATTANRQSNGKNTEYFGNKNKKENKSTKEKIDKNTKQNGNKLNIKQNTDFNSDGDKTKDKANNNESPRNNNGQPLPHGLNDNYSPIIDGNKGQTNTPNIPATNTSGGNNPMYNNGNSRQNNAKDNLINPNNQNEIVNHNKNGNEIGNTGINTKDTLIEQSNKAENSEKINGGNDPNELENTGEFGNIWEGIDSFDIDKFKGDEQNDAVQPLIGENFSDLFNQEDLNEYISLQQGEPLTPEEQLMARKEFDELADDFVENDIKQMEERNKFDKLADDFIKQDIEDEMKKAEDKNDGKNKNMPTNNMNSTTTISHVDKFKNKNNNSPELPNF